MSHVFSSYLNQVCVRLRTISTPRDHQSALCVCPLLLTTSGAIYSTVPQKEYAFLSASTDSLLKPKSVQHSKVLGKKLQIYCKCLHLDFTYLYKTQTMHITVAAFK